MSYYNTNNETGDTLTTSRRNTTTQETNILTIFRGRPGRPMTPFDVQDDLGHEVPITSIRRAITDLTFRGLLRKTSTMRSGRFGKMNHCWILTR